MTYSSLLTISILLYVLLFSPLGYGHSPSCGCSSSVAGSGHHHHDHGGDHIHHHHHHEHGDLRLRKLPEEVAEEEDLEIEEFGHHHHDHHDERDAELTSLGLWVEAMGCSLLVSLASLICLVILPVICFKGKPSKAVVDSLAVFGAGAMLGDAFLHQLPHAFGGEHSHSHDHNISKIEDHHHGHGHGHEHGHSHSLKDLSVGLSILSGIVLFLLVEKVVRYVEEHAKDGAHGLGHGHHHSHKRQKKLKDTDKDYDKPNKVLTDSKNKAMLDKTNGEKSLDSDNLRVNDDNERKTVLHKRLTSSDSTTDGKDLNDMSGPVKGPAIKKASAAETSSFLPSSSLIFGYLNLFSDGVHNFTDGMALGSAFLLHGSVGGWSRTLFLLAHELPQEDSIHTGNQLHLLLSGNYPVLGTLLALSLQSPVLY